MYSVAPMVLAVGAARFEAQMVWVFLAYGAAHAAAVAAIQCVLYPGPADRMLMDLLPSESTATTAFAAFILAFRRRVVARARAVVRADADRYTALWAAAAAAPGAAAALAALAAAEDDIAPRLLPRGVAPRQLNRRRRPRRQKRAAAAAMAGGNEVEVEDWVDDGVGIPGTVDPAAPVGPL
jgi:hypothetical protein